jgi:hypothetical protein
LPRFGVWKQRYDATPSPVSTGTKLAANVRAGQISVNTVAIDKRFVISVVNPASLRLPARWAGCFANAHRCA